MSSSKMIYLNFILAVLAPHAVCVFGQQTNSSDHVHELWFEQKLDHFDPQNTQKWRQRYFVNDKFYKSGGPAFLHLGGEVEVAMNEVTDYAWTNYAKQFGALGFVLEHRYYGKSRPVEDLSLPNLKYLTTHQALADLATFIVSMNGKYNLSSDCKWIAFGGSYPGGLATWLRIKYPHLVYAAVASSPVINVKADYGDYLSIGLKRYELHKMCMPKLQEGLFELDRHLETAEGRRKIDERFNLCSPLEQSVKNSRDMATFYYNIVTSFSGTTQGDCSYDNSITVKKVCDHITAADNAFDGLAAGLGYINKELGCLDYLFDNKVNALRNTSWSVTSPPFIYPRTWQYQICNEVGIFLTSSSLPGIFKTKFPLDYRLLECQYAFGEQYNASFVSNAVKTTNLMYGGTDTVASNVLFVQGTDDPWLNTQYSKEFKAKMPLITIKGTTHIEDALPITDRDPPQLKLARSKIASVINSWLNYK